MHLLWGGFEGGAVTEEEIAIFNRTFDCEGPQLEGERVLDRHWWRKPGGEWQMLPACTTSELLAASCVIGKIEVWPAIVLPANVTNRDTLAVVDGDPPDGSRYIATFERRPIDIGPGPHTREFVGICPSEPVQPEPECLECGRDYDACDCGRFDREG